MSTTRNINDRCSQEIMHTQFNYLKIILRGIGTKVTKKDV